MITLLFQWIIISFIDDPPYEGHFTFVEVLLISHNLLQLNQYTGKQYMPTFHCALPLYLSSAFRILNIQFKEVMWSFSVLKKTLVSAFFWLKTDGTDHEMESLESQKSQHMVKWSLSEVLWWNHLLTWWTWWTLLVFSLHGTRLTQTTYKKLVVVKLYCHADSWLCRWSPSIQMSAFKTF